MLNGPAGSPAIREISQPEHITFPTSGDDVAHGFFYRPKNSLIRGAGRRASAAHRHQPWWADGGRFAALDLSVQLWTSRGFAVVDVDYRGSTGYGRAYRAALDGRWGIADVDDCVNAARYLAAKDLVDGQRVLIRGASAGGYTTFAAMTAYPGVFSAGAAYFGVSDLEALAVRYAQVRSPVSRFIDRAVPGTARLYVERSPIHHVDRLVSPLILFQGLDDRIVPPNQTQMMADALRRKACRWPCSCSKANRMASGVPRPSSGASKPSSISMAWSWDLRRRGIASRSRLRTYHRASIGAKIWHSAAATRLIASPQMSSCLNNTRAAT